MCMYNGLSHDVFFASNQKEESISIQRVKHTVTLYTYMHSYQVGQDV